MTFNKNYVQIARRLFNTVYIDRITDTEVIGSKSRYDGDRIRIYRTDWEYESEIIIRDNEELKKLLTEEITDWLYEHDTAMEDCKRYFGAENLEDINPVALEDWIADHNELYEDYAEYFGIGFYG